MKDVSFGDEQFGNYFNNCKCTVGLVFMMMSFSNELMDTFVAVKDECKKLQLTCVRVDETTGSGIILKKIFNYIERAEFIIVDLTNERPNVYYELGYAHGIGNNEHNILLLAKKGTELHFDIAPLSIKFYSSTEELRKIVAENIKSYIIKNLLVIANNLTENMDKFCVAIDRRKEKENSPNIANETNNFLACSRELLSYYSHHQGQLKLFTREISVIRKNLDDFCNIGTTVQKNHEGAINAEYADRLNDCLKKIYEAAGKLLAKSTND